MRRLEIHYLSCLFYRPLAFWTVLVPFMLFVNYFWLFLFLRSGDVIDSFVTSEFATMVIVTLLVLPVSMVVGFILGVTVLIPMIILMEWPMRRVFGFHWYAVLYRDGMIAGLRRRLDKLEAQAI